ncbi:MULTISPECIES: hypothetical protein [unclassified Modestobacter]|uniref:hypothetical protein n=1 Tax=unclassified Modestobacter TaxID=2643866 RepID=UPI0022AA6E30|nr:MULTISPECIES: hypothetical protein [unclassified Modestobacter]MCZ2826722.1 hypothetical protein [Modestobacter sp. VKM Ac-2981]MCZ2855102.1 hypothetical protein [Modestobacter sp. VKM Ac-2982]
MGVGSQRAPRTPPWVVVIGAGIVGCSLAEELTPVVGEVLADLATSGATAHPISLFDPRRPALEAIR